MSILIRKEIPSDYEKINAFIKKAFETAEYPDEHVHEFVAALRTQDRYEPELALVAEVDGEIVGHVISMRTHVDTPNGKVDKMLALGPLSISLEMRNKGIGSKLMKSSLERACELGYRAVFLAGNPDYYHRFGYIASYKYNIIFAEIEALCEAMGFSVEHGMECIMVYELFPDALKGVEGNVILV